ncbi:hypothetical protein [Parapedobacter soli]|uniref:hypothetical protein n=1 Tax=Parapedobacter soli TaxID=416955 RepID=UPI0021CA365E|nr:hypothetical protein [Parapedobacter soli]
MKKIQIERLNRTKGAKSKNGNEPNFESDRLTPEQKTFKRRIGEKTYTIKVKYIEVSEEQWKIKRSAIESIVKQAWLKNN